MSGCLGMETWCHRSLTQKASCLSRFCKSVSYSKMIKHVSLGCQDHTTSCKVPHMSLMSQTNAAQIQTQKDRDGRIPSIASFCTHVSPRAINTLVEGWGVSTAMFTIYAVCVVCHDDPPHGHHNGRARQWFGQKKIGCCVSRCLKYFFVIFIHYLTSLNYIIY